MIIWWTNWPLIGRITRQSRIVRVLLNPSHIWDPRDTVMITRLAMQLVQSNSGGINHSYIWLHFHLMNFKKEKWQILQHFTAFYNIFSLLNLKHQVRLSFVSILFMRNWQFHGNIFSTGQRFQRSKVFPSVYSRSKQPIFILLNDRYTGPLMYPNVYTNAVYTLGWSVHTKTTIFLRKH